MDVSIGGVIVRADVVLSGLGHAPSTLWQYRWAWSQFESFCSRQGLDVLTEEVVASYLAVVADDYRLGEIKEWKRKLLRKSVLVLSEVARTGSYQWGLSRQARANDALAVGLRPVQERFEVWLGGRRLALTTRNLYATVSRTLLAWLPERGVTDVGTLTRADISAAVVFLGGRYRPGSMRTALTALRAWCGFLEECGYVTGLARAIPTLFARRVTRVGVLPAERVEALTNSPELATATGLRDRALLLLAARTGLRPVDMVALRLSDIDWREARITLSQHKTGRLLTLPLLADVGEAIAAYLLHDRPRGVADDHVFLRSQAPHVALSASGSLYDVAARAFARLEPASGNGAGHAHGRGFRVLRASFATRLLEEGTPLPVIAGALGHQGIDSAKHYLAADEERMRECCLDFTGIEPRGVRS